MFLFLFLLIESVLSGRGIMLKYLIYKNVFDFIIHATGARLLHMKSKLRAYDSPELAILGQQSAVLMLKRLQACFYFCFF
jgi:hypothetical protein